MTYEQFINLLEDKGLQVLNTKDGLFDVYCIGPIGWDTDELQWNGLISYYRFNENDYSRYAQMLKLSDRCKFIKP